jgi:hypothetical protein
VYYHNLNVTIYFTNTIWDQFMYDNSNLLRMINKGSCRQIIKQMQMENYAKISKERYFLICESCFWCASYFKSQSTFHKCPLCHEGKIECMPIGEDENYGFDYSPTKGVELKFSKNKVLIGH